MNPVRLAAPQQLLPVREPNEFRSQSLPPFLGTGSQLVPPPLIPPQPFGPPSLLAPGPQLPIKPAEQFNSNRPILSQAPPGVVPPPPPPGAVPPPSFPAINPSLNSVIDPLTSSEQSRGRNRVFRQVYTNKIKS